MRPDIASTAYLVCASCSVIRLVQLSWLMSNTRSHSLMGGSVVDSHHIQEYGLPALLAAPS